MNASTGRDAVDSLAWTRVYLSRSPCARPSRREPLTLTVNTRRLAVPSMGLALAIGVALALPCLMAPLSAQVPDIGKTATRGPVLRDALLVDADQSGTTGAGDELWLVFDQPLLL